MNRAEARVKKFQNSNTQLAGHNSNIPWYIKSGVKEYERDMATKLGRKQKKK